MWRKDRKIRPMKLCLVQRFWHNKGEKTWCCQAGKQVMNCLDLLPESERI